MRPLPTPCFTSPGPVELTSFPAAANDFVYSSGERTASVFSRPVVFSTPPGAVQFISSAVPNMPDPVPGAIRFYLTTSSFGGVATFVGYSVAFTTRARTGRNGFPSGGRLPTLSAGTCFVSMPPGSVPVTCSVICCVGWKGVVFFLPV